MSKSKKLFLRTLPLALVGVLFLGGNLFAVSAGLPTTGNDSVSQVTDLAGKIWNTVSIIIQILAIAAIVLAGVRYMFASADEKADIKQQTIILVVGAALVFAAVPIAKFIQNVANSTFGQ